MYYVFYYDEATDEIQPAPIKGFPTKSDGIDAALTYRLTQLTETTKLYLFRKNDDRTLTMCWRQFNQ